MNKNIMSVKILFEVAYFYRYLFLANSNMMSFRGIEKDMKFSKKCRRLRAKTSAWA